MKYIEKCTNFVVEVSKNFTSYSSDSLLSLGIVNAVLAVPTVAANALVIVAILTTSSLQTPSYLLLASLAVSDLAGGLLLQPLLSLLSYTILNEHVEASCYISTLHYGVWLYSSWVLIFTATAISVDRYLAIRLKMRYKTVVTVLRTKLLVTAIWVLAFFALISPFVFKLGVKLYGILGGILETICLIFILFCYTMSFRALKIHRAQILPQGNQQPNSTTQSNAINVLKYKKLLKTMILMVVLVCICYLSLVGVLITLSVAPTSDRWVELQKFSAAYGFPIVTALASITTLNSTLDPVIYLARMRDLRKACNQTLKKIFRCR